MAAGTLNEPNVLRGVHDFLSKHADGKLSVQHIRELGLVQDRELPFLATSPDGVMCIEMIVQGADKVKAIALLEVKTRVSPNISIRLAEEKRDELGQIYFPRLNEQGPSLKALHQAIPELNDRAQVLHHAATFNIPYLLFVEATTSRIIRAVSVEVPQRILKAYRTSMTHLAHTYLQWIYASPRATLPRLTFAELGYASDMHTLMQRLDLHTAALKLCTEHLKSPLPNIERIVSNLVSNWNATKGGVDVMSRYLANAKASPYQNIGLEAVFWDRLFMTAILNAFHLSKWARVGHRLDDFSTFSQLNRAAAGDHHHFNDFLVRALDYFRSKAPSFELNDVLNQSFPVDYGAMVERTRKQFLNTEEGRTLRHVDTRGHIPYQTKQRRCKLCQGHDTRWCCKICDVSLCTKYLGNHPKDTRDNAENQFSSCFSLWHDNSINL